MNSELIDVIRVVPLQNYQLELTFANDEVRVFDMTAYLHKKPFNQLTEQNRFMTAHVDYGTVVWAGNIDISPETLYDRSVLSSSAPQRQRSDQAFIKPSADQASLA